jgi:hypothetical protein
MMSAAKRDSCEFLVDVQARTFGAAGQFGTPWISTN